MNEKPKVIAIVGPTATGKSDLAVRVARAALGEVVSADSRQVYRGLDIGTGKISRREMRGVPHHLIDIADPKRAYSAARFQRDGKKAISEILSRGKAPIVAGGTGFYVDALLFDMKFPPVRQDPLLRKKLATLSLDELNSRLAALDPRRSKEVDSMNRVRLIRAIEIATHYGPAQPLSTTSPYDILWIGLTVDREHLRERIKERLKKRLRKGMMKEFSTLHARGLSFRRMEELGLEYRYGARLLEGRITRDEFEHELTREILAYAKRQMTWWKRNKDIRWFEADADTAPVIALVRRFLEIEKSPVAS